MWGGAATPLAVSREDEDDGFAITVEELFDDV